ncbi:hypothetical protein Tco_1300219 [Tanacetum coccineum]
MLIKWISPKECQERLNNGLCFNCDSMHGHKCPGKFLLHMAEEDDNPGREIPLDPTYYLEDKELASRLKGCPIPILSARINGDDVLYHQEACDGLDHQDACDGIYRQNGGTVFLDFDPEDSLELRIFGSSWHLFCDPL